MNDATPLLSAENLSFAYRERSVLNGVSLSLGSGEFVGVIGVNGSGKSTLLRLLLGLLPPSAGDVRLRGTPLRSLGRRDIALQATLMSQDIPIAFDFTAREIVAMGRTPHIGRFSPEAKSDREAIAEAMRLTETLDLSDRPVNELSGGERQRVHLARALAQHTDVIALDEPTASLDLAHRFELLRLIKNLTREGRAAIAAIHDLSLAVRFCDRILLLADGKIMAAGKPADVVTEDNLNRHFALRARVKVDDDTGDLFVSVLDATADMTGLR